MKERTGAGYVLGRGGGTTLAAMLELAACPGRLLNDQGEEIASGGHKRVLGEC